MAATGAMADFARLPNSRKVLLFVAIAMMLGLLYYRFVFKTLTEDVENAENQFNGARNLRAQLEADIPKFQALVAEMKQLSKSIEENAKALPTEAEVPAFFETLERKVKESGVETTRWSKRPEESVDLFVKVPVDIEFEGTFPQIKRFFASLVQKDITAARPSEQVVEERERIVSIENLQISKPTVKNREVVLAAKFTAVTFRQADGAPPPALQAPAKPAEPGAPPMPSPASPAGAKVRTEDALEKIDDRTRDKGEVGGGSARLQGGL